MATSLSAKSKSIPRASKNERTRTPLGECNLRTRGNENVEVRKVMESKAHA